LFDSVPKDCKVFLFYYPSAMPDEILEARLRTLGEQTGNNLFVNIGRLDDPKLPRIIRKFDIQTYPVVVLTADATLASNGDEPWTVFVRIDSKALFKSPDHAIECIQTVFTLFLRGDVSKAIVEAKSRERAELLRALGGFSREALKTIWKFVSETDIAFSIAEGKLELKHSHG
jgi:hypothetical protein